MDFSKKYSEKLVSAKEAAGVIKSGDRVEMGWAAGVSKAVDKELAKRVDELDDVIFYGGLAFETPEVIKADPEGKHFTWNTWHAGGPEEKRSMPVPVPSIFLFAIRSCRSITETKWISMWPSS